MTRPAQRPQLPNGLDRLKPWAQTLVDLVATYVRATDHRFPGHPAVTLEIAGHAANGVISVGPDIDMPGAVEIHRIGAKTARHELRQAHGSGVGALEAQRVELLFTGQQEELTQLLAEKIGPRRVVEAQGRQGVDHPVIAGITAKKGFHADDRDNHLGRHAVFLLGTGQGRFMLAPEIDAAGHSRIGDKNRPVFLPRLDPFRRARNSVENALLALDLTEHLHQLLTGKAVVAGHFRDELGHLRRTFVVTGQRARACPQTANQAYPWRTSSRPTAQYLH